MYDYRQFPGSQTQFYPGFPFFPPTPAPGPGPGPSPLPRDIERRIVQLERITQRQGEEIERLNRRVRRLERQMGFGIGGPQY